MTLTFRDTKGSNLTPAEADANIRDLDGRITDLEETPPQAVGISNITVSGTQMTIYLADATVLGPYTLPQAAFRPSVVIEVSAATLTLAPAHANAFLVFTNAGGCVVTLDDDSILSTDQEINAYAETDGPVTFESPTDIELRPPPGFLRQIKGYGFTVGFKKRAAGGGFEESSITADGMYMDNAETNRPNAVGALFDDLKAGLAAGCTVVMEIDFRSSPSGSFLWLLSGIDNTFGNFIAGAYVFGDVEVDDPADVGLVGGNPAFNDDPGIKRLAVTFSRHTGGNYEYAVSSEGTAATTQTVTYAPSSSVNNITLFHDGQDGSILDDAYVRTITLYPAKVPADLPALTA